MVIAEKKPIFKEKKPSYPTKRHQTTKKSKTKKINREGNLSLPTETTQIYKATRTAWVTTKDAAQTFVASGHEIRSIVFSVKPKSHYDRITIQLSNEQNQSLFYKEVSIYYPNKEVNINLTSNPIKITRGERYELRIKGSNEFDLGLARNKKRYPFGRVFCQKCNTYADLAGEIKGVRYQALGTKPALKKKALLVLIENGGYSFGFPTEVNPIKVSVPTGYVKCGTHRLKLTNPIKSGVEIARWIKNYLKNGGSVTDPCLRITAIKDRWITEMRKVDVAQKLKNSSDYYLEEAGKGLINSLVRNKYDRIIFLEDRQFNNNNIINRLMGLQSNYLVDIHILAHGSKEGFTGGNSSNGGAQDMSQAGFFIPMKQAIEKGELKVTIRSVFQQNCFGSYHNQAWLGLNAGVVTGSQELNYMPFTYGTFLRHWANDKSFKQAVIAGYNEVKPFYQYSYGLINSINANRVINDSMPVVEGNGFYHLD